MASGFAGVTTANDQVNDLIIRGNMPSGMLLRLDGMNAYIRMEFYRWDCIVFIFNKNKSS